MTKLNLQMERPLAVFDIEATGANPRADRIVELAIIKIFPGGRQEHHVFRINPGIPIPPEVTKIHGITDADVADKPPFGDIAPRIVDILQDCDLCGYNVIRFDIPMLEEEMKRVRCAFSTEGRRIIDPQRIYHRRVPRDLTAALAYYCGEMHIDAHGAEADALATWRVLEGQLAKYPDIPRDVEGLDAYSNPRDPSWADRSGRLKWQGGQIVLNFGQKRGTPLRDIIASDPNFIKWMMRSDFPRDTLELIEKAQRGQWPSPPAPAPDAFES